VRRVVSAEALGTGVLLCAVVGSGIMAERLFPDQSGLALLANSVATGAALTAAIVAFGPVSGGHFNPLVTMALAVRGTLAWTRMPAKVSVKARARDTPAQALGALAGVVAAHAMFEEPLVTLSTQARHSTALMFSESVATFGLLAVVWSTTHRPHPLAPVAVAGYVTAAYWFTASTAFANPAATLARAFTDTFAGIRPVDVPAFVLAQCAGATAAVSLCTWLLPRTASGDAPPGDDRRSGGDDRGRGEGGRHT
jgi:glycerol uptake facilitator-like aquaporin